MKHDFDKVYLVSKDPLHLSAVHHCKIFVAGIHFALLSSLASHDLQVFLESGREALKEFFIDAAEALQGKIFEGEGTRLYDAGDVVIVDVEGKDLEELEYLGVQFLEVDAEVTRRDIHRVFLRTVHREELLKHVLTVGELGIVRLQT